MVPALDLDSGDLAPNGWPRALLRGFKAGERAALTEVYRRHVDEVATLLQRGFGFEAHGQRHRFVGYRSAFELQDTLHETFRRAFEPSARASYDGLRPYGAYVTTIARNLVLRSFRAREVLFPLAELDPGQSASGAPRVVADAGPSPEREVHDAQVRELVAAFVETLDPGERRLLELRWVEGLSQRDAAEALGIGRQRIRGQEKLLRAKLLAYLRGRGEAALLAGVDGIDGLLGLVPAALATELLGWLGEVTR